jgi:predicted DNA-binding transcriptional regulator YafY
LLDPHVAGRLRFGVEVSQLDDIWPWVLSWGSGANVIAPRELAAKLTEEAAATIMHQGWRRPLAAMK